MTDQPEPNESELSESETSDSGAPLAESQTESVTEAGPEPRPAGAGSEIEEDEGPGWMPAILAGTLLLGIFGFVFCAFTTWLLFQKRTEFAVRTLRGTFITDVEQSLLDPESKTAVVKEIKELADDMERGKYEDWQSAAVMQRLQRLPVIQWGELEAIESFLKKNDGDDVEKQIQELSRLRRAVELGQATSFDVEDVLKPVRESDPASSNGHRLINPLNEAAIGDTLQRAKLLSDRASIPEELFEDVDIDAIVRREIEVAAREGGF